MDLQYLYGSREQAQKQAARFEALKSEFVRRFGSADGVTLISAPGRTEIAGNHTDHNHGCVLAASVDMDSVAAVKPNGSMSVTLYSDMYNEPFTVDLSCLEPVTAEKESTFSLIRGMAAGLKKNGCEIGGFDACVTSSVQRGSGLSSSAAFEVMLGKIMSVLFNEDRLGAVENAKISQWAENNFFMKPCGLMDQMASAVGGLVYIDFAGGDAEVESVKYDFAGKGFTPCVVSAGGDHGNLTDEYASIPAEMKAVAKCLGGETLRDVEDKIATSLPALKGKVSDVRKMVAALKNDDLNTFFENMILSGESSWKLLQNLYVAGGCNQEMPLALEMSRRFLSGRGAWRIHGGGFAGTILAFVPTEMLNEYTKYMEAVFGVGAVKPMFIRPEGAVRL